MYVYILVRDVCCMCIHTRCNESLHRYSLHHIYTYIHINIYIYMLPIRFVGIFIHTYTITQACAHTHTHIYIHTHSHTHAHTRTHTQSPTHRHTHTTHTWGKRAGVALGPLAGQVSAQWHTSANPHPSQSLTHSVWVRAAAARPTLCVFWFPSPAPSPPPFPRGTVLENKSTKVSFKVVFYMGSFWANWLLKVSTAQQRVYLQLQLPLLVCVYIYLCVYVYTHIHV